MVTVRLTDNSKIGRLNITPKQEITRKEEATVSVKWAVLRLSDPNYFFVFGEEDKDELLELNERFLQVFSTEIGKEISSSKQLLEELLPAPKRTILPKPSLKKPKAQTKPKSSLKK